MSNAFKGLKIEDDDEEEVIVAPKTVAKPVTVAPPVAAPPPTSTKKGGDRSTTTYTPGEKKFRPRNSDDAAFNGEKKRAPREPRGDKPAHEGNKNERQSHDGRGQGSQVKRGGRGKANWGDAKDEIKNPVETQVSEATDAANVDAKPEGEVAAEVAAPVAEVAATPAEPEAPKTFTLEEFKKQQAAAAVKLAAKPLRQANEGADLSQWAGAEQIKPSDDSKTSDNKVKVGTAQRSGRVQLLDVAFGAASSYESRPPRSGPRPTTGGEKKSGDYKGEYKGEYKGKSAGGRGGYKGTRVPNVASNVDFPSL